MNEKQLMLIFGALLHDIGKVIQRATQEKRTHAKIGAEFFDTYFDFGDAQQGVKNQIAYHHARALRMANLEANDLAYITYFADNIASATDRRPDEEENSSYYDWDTFTNQQDIFSVFGDQKFSPERFYSPSILDDRSGMNIGNESSRKYTKGDYAAITERIKNSFSNAKFSEEYLSSVINTLEATMSYVPSSTNNSELRDVSLFDHSKMVAAFASAIYQYFESQNEHDYRKRLFTMGDSSFYNESAFLLVSFDFSGIQDFIFDIANKKVAKQLRARSLYLQLMGEYLADHLLKKLQLSRANLLYSGGGHAYLIVANTVETKNIIDDFEQETNQFLLDNFQTSLYVAFGYHEFAAHDIMPVDKEDRFANVAERYANLFKAVGDEISRKKLHRYSPAQLLRLNKHTDTHWGAADLDEKGDPLNRIANKLAKFSNKVYKDYFYVDADDSGLPVGVGKYIHGDSKKAVLDLLKDGQVDLVYAKNKFMTGENQSTHIWLGDYDYYHQNQIFDDSDQKSTLKSFPDYASENENGRGIQRLGVLRADIDDLGYSFIAGYNQIDSGKYVSLSRTATFSRSVGLIFQFYINKLVANRKLQIIYSGGDDTFIIGYWQDVLDFAVDLRKSVAAWSGNKLTMSAGIGIFTSSTPVNIMAEQTGELEEVAKSFDFDGDQDADKNGVAVFDSHWVFDFNQFITNVYEGKLRVIREYFASTDSQGKTFIYRLLDLLRTSQSKGDNKISLARLAYLLTRLEPKKDSIKYDAYIEFKHDLLEWVTDAPRELELALQIYIYEIREG